MKKSNWFKNLNLADEKYIAEANPDINVFHINRKRIITSVAATAACFALVVCNLWLFKPFSTTMPDVSNHKKSEYYDIIQKLNAATWEKPKHQNNFEIITDDLSFVYNGLIDSVGIRGDDKANGAVMPEASVNTIPLSTTGTYEEVTDNQVEGITEADRIKRSDKNIFYLDNQTLRIFSIAGLDSQELGHIELYENSKNYYLNKWEFYLSEDCRTATVITQYYTKDKQLCVGVIALDVSNPENIVEKNRMDIIGNYMSSRITNGKLLLFTEFILNKNDIDFDDESTFLPQINTGNGMQTIPASSIIAPEEINNTRYTIVMKMDENSLELEATAAYLSYTEDVYVSNDHIFLTRVFADIKKGEDNSTVRNSMTEISCLSYGDSAFTKKGSVIVRGYVKDQWSMDEYEGVLRVVTTTNATAVNESSYNRGENVSADILVTATGASNASLYCVDLSTFEVVASVEDFAPPREEVQSVRFDKTTAYVCTSIEMSDPVFFFDLSDINNITYKDTGTIEGFSTSLIDFGSGKLLGIGVGDWNTFKVELYQETEDGVEGFCEYELQDATYSPVYKSYYIDRENQLIGLGVNVYNSPDGQNQRYIVLFFDGYNFVELINVPLNGTSEFQRGVYIDDFMYMFGEEDFKVEGLFN